MDVLARYREENRKLKLALQASQRRVADLEGAALVAAKAPALGKIVHPKSEHKLAEKAHGG